MMSTNFNRKKRITDPFDDEAKARVFGRFEPGSVSSGSEHSAHKFDEEDIASPSLSDLFCGVLLDNDSAEWNTGDSGRETDQFPEYDSAGLISDLKMVFSSNKYGDSFKDVLRANVVRSMDLFSDMEKTKSSLLRNVMAFLRNLGYNAAICKTKWETSGGLNAGNYEFIDVIRSDSSTTTTTAAATTTRYFIDLDFVSEFELARPTKSYEEIVKLLPRFFIGKGEELKQILRIVSDGGRRSLKSGGLHIPPWRKHRFMQQKYFGPYKRTINVFSAPFASSTPCNKVVAVKCRAVGFDDSGVKGRLFPAATRTR